ncbi:MAG: hypothetical protein GX995_05840 [Clostridiales bacterium]|nr:hypothetical protein [Clostridiales bacterium]
MNKKNKNKNFTITCNMCGKDIKTHRGMLMEDAFEGYKEWGYFSNKDLEVHKFTLCEDCYDKMIKSFKIPVEVSEKIEVMYPGK